MSYSTLLKVYRSKCRWDLELPNSHGTFPAAEDYLCNKYVPGSKPWLFDRVALKHIDQLFLNGKLDLSDAVAHFFIWDRALIKREHVPLCVEPLKIFAKNVSEFRGPEYVNHWPTIAKWIAEVKLDRRCLGVALNTTSCADVWDYYPQIYSTDEPIQYTSDLIFGGG